MIFPLLNPESFSVIIAAVALYLSYNNIRKSNITKRDSEISSCAVRALERAYNALTNGKVNIPPEANRLNWLTAARLIENYKKLKSTIKLEEYKTVCEESEEHWRHQFYLILNMHNISSIDYYKGIKPPNSSNREYLEPRSLIVIYNFALWRKDKKDPIDSVDLVKILEEKNIFDGNYGLRYYLLEELPKRGYEIEEDRMNQVVVKAKVNKQK